jgi:phospholipid/cholesterol/gamma-HCH transport system substrate-binding protein
MRKRIMKRFREMNPVVIGIAGVTALAVAAVGAFELPNMPGFSGPEYRADFTDAAGLQASDHVRIAGVNVGDVRAIAVSGAKVVVTFTVGGGARLGDKTSAAIKTETLLGRKYLQVQSLGSGSLPAGTEIPLSRTTTPYDLTAVTGELTNKVAQLNVDQLAQAANTFANTFGNMAPDIGPALEGVSRLSQVISDRNAALSALLEHADSVTGVLNSRVTQLKMLLADGTALLEELIERRNTIAQLLANVSSMAQQMTGLVNDNQQQLAPTLHHLNDVLTVLKQNEGNIATAIQRLGPFALALGEAVGSAPAFSAIIENLVPGSVVPAPDLAGGSR